MIGYVDVQNGKAVIRVPSNVGKTQANDSKIFGALSQLNRWAETTGVNLTRDVAQRELYSAYPDLFPNPDATRTVEDVQTPDRERARQEADARAKARLKQFVQTLAESGKKMLGPAQSKTTKPMRKASRPRWRQ